MSNKYDGRDRHLRMQTMAYAAFAAIALSSAAFGQFGDPAELEPDPISLKLEMDITAVQEGLESIRRPVLEELQKRRELARQSGDLHRLEQATKDITEFEKSDKLPATLKAAKPELAKQFRKSYEEILQRMVDHFNAAIQEYTRQDRVDAAKAVERQLEKFKASVRSPLPSWAKDAKNRPSRKRRVRRR
jgi:DNA anti-recombination protein RmuC